MASKAAIAIRRAEVTARMQKVREAFADTYGVEIPEPGSIHVGQPELAQVMELEQTADLLESILMLVAPSDSDAASEALASTVLSGTVADIKASLANVGTVSALQSLYDAEIAGRDRAGVKSAIESRIAALEAEEETESEEVEDESDV